MNVTAGTPRLDDLPALCWRALESACATPDAPWRFAALGTATQFDAALRTVVLRGADASKRQLTCHTDARAPKVHHLRLNPHVQWLFHNAAARTQLRACALAMAHHGDAIARAAWAAVPLANRIHNCSLHPPGTPVRTPDDALPAAWESRAPTMEEAEAGFENFAVLVTTVDCFEWLQLHGDGRHRRASFTWTGERWAGVWLAP